MDTSKQVSDHSGAEYFIWVVELNRFSLWLVGLWPKIDEDAKSGIISDLRTGIVFVTLTFFSGIPFICALARVWGDMILMIENLEITLTFLVVLLKLTIMRWKRSAVSSVLKMMLEDWLELKLDKERQVMTRRMQIMRLIMIYGYCFMASGFIIIIVLSSFGVSYRHLTNITDGNRTLPLQAYYFYDTDKSPQFELTFIVQSVSLFFVGIIYTSVDAFLGLSVFHMCGQLEIFRRRITKWVLSENFDGTLRKNVEMHRRLIRFAGNVEDAFSVLMLGLVFYFAIVFCLCTFLFLAMFTSKYDIPLTGKVIGIIGSVTIFAHTFLYCEAGEIIVEQCEAVYRTICNLDWYKLEPRRARCLILLMIRTKEPSRITAGKVVPLTMTTFCNLLKTSAGYISFLLAMRS